MSEEGSLKGDMPTRVDLDPARIDSWRTAILDLKVQSDYASDPTWVRRDPFNVYCTRWLDSDQPDTFLDNLRESLSDPRTIAEAWVDKDRLVGFLWVVFRDEPGVTIAEIRDVAVAGSHRQRGLGHELLEHAARVAAERGAHVIHGDVAADNTPARRAIEAAGARPVSILYERVLHDPE